MRLLSPGELVNVAETLSNDGFCARPAEIFQSHLPLLTPPEQISTVECAEQYRVFRSSEGSGRVKYDRWRTPYNVGAMDLLDRPDCNLLVMVKPSRSGGTTVAENFLFKMMKFGPMGEVGWYLNSDAAVKKYVELIVKPMFEDHPDLQAKIGLGRSDNNDLSKRVSGRLVEWLAAADANFRNKEPLLMVADETDGWAKKYADSPVIEIKARQKQLGHRKKGIVMSHPDKGWGSGVAAAWINTSRGIYIMQCGECGDHAAAHATKYWPDVPEFRLHYQRDPEARADERLDMAERTAAMVCPHCGAALDDTQRKAMVDGGEWMHRGQTLDPQIGIVGNIDPTTEYGVWVHGLMLKVVSVAELAKDMEAATLKWENSKKSTQLRTFMSKQLGEIFEGKAGLAKLDSTSLQKRANTERVLQVGECPPHVRFITASVDVGAGKFDVSWRGWDLEARSWWLDRLTIRQRLWPDGLMRDIRTRERIEDWDVLITHVLKRTFPIMGKPGFAMPVAVMTIDVGDGNVVWKGREFARRALQRGHFWGSPQQPWAKVRLIHGASSAKAPELPVAPTKISKDEHGRVVQPVILEYSLGVHKLKELAIERLGVDDGGPGQCLFAEGIASNYYEEYFNERLVDDKWERFGDNESLDLFAYEEAGRLMLRPDRADIKWDKGLLPPWARPVPVIMKGGDLAVAGETSPSPVDAKPAPTQKPSIFERFDNLNRKPKPNG
jgi:phage terminase large subunit GpA-like protein